MSSVLTFTIRARTQNTSLAQSHHDDNSRQLYCDQVKITTQADGFSLLTTNDEIHLEDGDHILCGAHEILLKIGPNVTPQIAFHEPRSPTTSLSEQWQQAGLDTFMSNETIAPTHFLPSESTAHHTDPLAFLQSPIMTNNNGQPLQAPISANSLQENFVRPLLAEPDITQSTSHISQSSRYQPLAMQSTTAHTDHNTMSNLTDSTSSAHHAPIDDISSLYQESQSQNLNYIDQTTGASEQTATTTDQQHIKELYHLINQ